MNGTPLSPSASRRPGFGLAGALVALLLVGTAATGGWYAARSAQREARIRDGAAILAEHGLREFANSASPLALLELPVGADTIVLRTRVFADEVTSGMVAVQIGRAADATFRVKATGRLDAGSMPYVCSYDLTWEIDREPDARRALDPGDGPLCNGSRRRRPEDGAAQIQRSGRTPGPRTTIDPSA